MVRLDREGWNQEGNGQYCRSKELTTNWREETAEIWEPLKSFRSSDSVFGLFFNVRRCFLRI